MAAAGQGHALLASSSAVRGICARFTAHHDLRRHGALHTVRMQHGLPSALPVSLPCIPPRTRSPAAHDLAQPRADLEAEFAAVPLPPGRRAALLALSPEGLAARVRDASAHPSCSSQVRQAGRFVALTEAARGMGLWTQWAPRRLHVCMCQYNMRCCLYTCGKSALACSSTCSPYSPPHQGVMSLLLGYALLRSVPPSHLAAPAAGAAAGAAAGPPGGTASSVDGAAAPDIMCGPLSAGGGAGQLGADGGDAHLLAAETLHSASAGNPPAPAQPLSSRPAFEVALHRWCGGRPRGGHAARRRSPCDALPGFVASH